MVAGIEPSYLRFRSVPFVVGISLSPLGTCPNNCHQRFRIYCSQRYISLLICSRSLSVMMLGTLATVYEMHILSRFYLEEISTCQVCMEFRSPAIRLRKIMQTEEKHSLKTVEIISKAFRYNVVIFFISVGLLC